MTSVDRLPDPLREQRQRPQAEVRDGGRVAEAAAVGPSVEPGERCFLDWSGTRW